MFYVALFIVLNLLLHIKMRFILSRFSHKEAVISINWVECFGVSVDINRQRLLDYIFIRNISHIIFLVCYFQEKIASTLLLC